MNFYQAHTYWESLQQLKSTQGAQKAVIDSVNLLLEDDKHPSLQLHPLNNAKDPNMWSVRAGLGFRIILHRTNVDTVLLYAGLHDPAYKWGENRVLKTHPKTGSMQIVVLREEEEIVKSHLAVPVEITGNLARQYLSAKSCFVIHVGLGLPTFAQFAYCYVFSNFKFINSTTPNRIFCT